MKNKYGTCPRCQVDLQPVWFKETEITYTNGSRHVTGRTRTACSHLECPVCLKKECVDDTFDGSWSFKCEQRWA